MRKKSEWRNEDLSRRLIIGISGASGAIYGIRMLETLRKITSIESHLVLTSAARITIPIETDWQVADVEALADVNYEPDDIGAPIASGSFPTMGMIVAPCSIKTLSAIANSYDSDLISRAADVQLKEGRGVLLLLRETPLHRGHIRLMDLAAKSGAIIMPAVPAFYGPAKTVDDIVEGIVGRALARMNVDKDYYHRWLGQSG